MCGEDLNFSESSLVCVHKHTYNINRKGYIDLRKKKSVSEHYNEAFFEARLVAMKLGLYADLITALHSMISTDADFPEILDPAAGVDVGCGDGFITRALNMGIGLDLSMEGIRVAARGGGDTAWVCADGAHLPLVDGSVSWILNVFAPSEYADFARVSPHGFLVKVVPGPTHMHELRKRVGLPEETQDSATVLFERRLRVISHRDIVQTTELSTQEARRAVSTMSPVGFDRLSEGEAWKDLESITTHSRILVGRLP